MSEDETPRPAPKPPIEVRAATLGEVNFPERLIEVVAVPYEQEALVEYRGELWHESFDRGSFNGVERTDRDIKAYRDHAPGPGGQGMKRVGLVGRAIALHSDHDRLAGEVKIAKTTLGDETLELAAEGLLGVSVGFGVRGSDQALDRASKRRRIRRAFLDHLAFPDQGAYAGAGVVAVRVGPEPEVLATDLPPLYTPRVDEVRAWLESRRHKTLS